MRLHRVFLGLVKTFFQTTWTYLAIASIAVTYLLLPERWRSVALFGIAPLLVISACRVAWIIQSKLERLRGEIEQLKNRPYDQAQYQLVQEKLQRWTTTERDLLRFLLQRGQVEDQAIVAACQAFPYEGTQAIERLWHDGLITKSEEPIPDRAGIRTFWQISAQFEAILKDLLYPRKETDSRRHFKP